MPLCCIVPPQILDRLVRNSSESVREAALATLVSTSRLRGERAVRAMLFSTTSPDGGRRTIYDCRNGTNLSSARLARTEEGPASADASVNRAFDGLGATRDFFRQVLGRNSIDDQGMRLNAYVHYDREYQNAFWDGEQMVFGDGDGEIFVDFTKSLDVIAHELTHGVTEFTANLVYRNQPGALNESMSDVFGVLVKQYSLRQSAEQADWLIGAEILTPAFAGDALRSMKAPGTAYSNPMLGNDPQPAHMDDYVNLPDTARGDWGGVHINSGIPNKAFYLAATAIGGFAWEAPGHIWYESLKASSVDTNFQQFADTTYAKAGQLYGTSSRQQQIVYDAWDGVGIKVTGGTGTPEPKGDGEASLQELTRQVARIGEQVQRLAADVETLKGGAPVAAVAKKARGAAGSRG